MRNLMPRLRAIALLAIFISGCSVFGQEYATIEAMAPMRDGVKLATTAHVPPGDGLFPAILVRTPYNKDGVRGMVGDLNKHGYVLVAQDCRGRFASEGVYVPFLNDSEDGYDAVEWCAEQSWSNGKIGMWGGSAGGITANLAAAAAPPHLVCSYVVVAPEGFRNEMFMMGGLYRKEMIDGWMQAQNAVDVRKDWTSRKISDPYFDAFEISPRYDKIKVPMYNVGGWFDIFCRGSAMNFQGIQTKGAGEARGNQKLVMGAAAHGPLNSRFKTYPNKGGDLRGGDMMRWFNYWLKGEQNGIMDEPAVNYFLMGDAELEGGAGNKWIAAETWPPESNPTSYYIHANGALSTNAPTESDSATSFNYDPTNPVKSVGGQNLIIPKGPMDQREIVDRADYFRFHSEPMAEPLTIIGEISVELHVATDAPDTDFMAKLVDVYPDGYEALIADSGLRVRFREGFDKEVMMTPGKVEKITIDLWHTALVFEKRHRIGVHITSSNDPRFDPNPNTGKPLRADEETRVAKNTFHHDASRPSRIILPVVEKIPD